MSLFSKRDRPLFVLAIVLLVVVAYFVSRPAPPTVPAAPPSLPQRPALSLLATPPDWSRLEIYQNTITRGEFERLLGRAVRPIHVARAMHAGEIHADVLDVLARVRGGLGLGDARAELRASRDA